MQKQNLYTRITAPTDPSFEQWFGNSCVRDFDGNPLAVFHGTYVHTSRETGEALIGDVHSFDRTKSVTTVRRAPSLDTVGSWFSDNPSEEGGAGMYGNTIYPVFVRLQRPKTFENFAQLEQAYQAALRVCGAESASDALRLQLQGQGFDGIVILSSDSQERLELQEEISELSSMLKVAYLEVSQSRESNSPDKEIHLAKALRLEQRLQFLKEEMSRLFANNSTEFDRQNAYIVFEPEQIKSAYGCKNFDLTNSFLTNRSPQEVVEDIAQYTQDAMQRNRIKKIQAHVFQMDQMQQLRFLSEAIAERRGGSAYETALLLQSQACNGTYDAYWDLVASLVGDEWDDIKAADEQMHHDFAIRLHEATAAHSSHIPEQKNATENDFSR